MPVSSAVGERVDRLGPDRDGVRLPGDDVAHDAPPSGWWRRPSGRRRPGARRPGRSRLPTRTPRGSRAHRSRTRPRRVRCARRRGRSRRRLRGHRGRCGRRRRSHRRCRCRSRRRASAGPYGRRRGAPRRGRRRARRGRARWAGRAVGDTRSRSGTSRRPRLADHSATPAGLVDDAGHDDAAGDGPEALGRGRSGEPGGRVEDRRDARRRGHGHGRSSCRSVRRTAPDGVDQGTFDARAADVEGDRYRVVRMILSKGHFAHLTRRSGGVSRIIVHERSLS